MTIIWCMVPEIWSLTEFFVILSHFLPFYPTTTQKIKIKKKKKIKTPEDIIILQKCTKNHHHMLHFSWDMALGGLIVIFHLRLLFALLPPPPPIPHPQQPIKSKCLKISSVYTNVPKSWSYVVLFLRYGKWRM